MHYMPSHQPLPYISSQTQDNSVETIHDIEREGDSGAVKLSVYFYWSAAVRLLYL